MRVKSMKIAPKISIRFTRKWRGFSVGDIISPPGGGRQILLQAKDHLGNKVAEVVEDEPEFVETIGERPDDSDPGVQIGGFEADEVKRGPGRPRKGDTK
ncbi:MAG: hypothetical protein Q7T25_14125 [Sideroxyarcus sp.]|nr:hypothetical protein [Sideroxyarcus sp.]